MMTRRLRQSPSLVSPTLAASPLLAEATALRARVEGLQALLELQRRQFERLDRRFNPATPAQAAARRLLALKERERGAVP